MIKHLVTRRGRPTAITAALAEAELLRLWILSVAPDHPAAPADGER
jgi:hypothetical protein